MLVAAWGTLSGLKALRVLAQLTVMLLALRYGMCQLLCVSTIIWLRRPIHCTLTTAFAESGWQAIHQLCLMPTLTHRFSLVHCASVVIICVIAVICSLHFGLEPAV